MKLYTREQMIDAFNYGKKLEGFDWIGDMIDSLTPIELPSDKEIEKAANTQSHYEGAMWLKQQIKQQGIGH